MKKMIHTQEASQARLNEVMSEYFQEPFLARAAVQVFALPKGEAVEVDAIMTLKI